MGVKRTILAAVAASLIALPVSAAVVSPPKAVVSQTQILDRDGATLRYGFEGFTPAEGWGKLTISTGAATTGGPEDAGIDLDGDGYAGGQESFRVWVEGERLGQFTCGGRAEGRILDHTMNGAADCEFSLNLWLSPTRMAKAFADGALTLAIRFGAGVGHHGDGDEVKVSLTYTAQQVVAAPLPASAAMLLGGLGLAGFAARRRKSKS